MSLNALHNMMQNVHSKLPTLIIWLVLTLHKLPIQKSEITGVISLLLTNQLAITLFSLLTVKKV